MSLKHIFTCAETGVKATGAVAKSFGAFAKNNASGVLIVVGTVAVCGAVVKAIIDGPKVKEDIKEAQEKKGEELNRKEKVKTAVGRLWPVFLLTGVGVGCYIGAHIIDVSSCVNEAAKLEVLRRGYDDLKKEHQSYVTDTQAVMTQEQKETVANNGAIRRQKQHPVDYGHIVDTGSGDTLFFEPESGQYFTASPEYVTQSVNTFNYNAMTNNGQGSINDWLECLGLEQGGMAFNRYGWDVMSNRLLDVSYYQPKPLEDSDAKWAAELVYCKAANELD